MKLNEFLVKAKLQGYPTGEAEKLETGAKVLSYQNGEYVYKDTYFGFDPFIGEEVVFYQGKFIWGMNYYGKVVSDKVSAKEVYEFLKKAMQLVKEDRPFRGPSNFKEDDWEYIDEFKGTIENFKGNERIYYQQELVYELDYQGGLIKGK
jgi:hypothetical protein